MKPLLVFLIGASAALAQPLSIGVKGGIPLSDFLDASKSVISGSSFTQTTAYQQITKRYIAGPTVELRLPAGFSIELDALYRHLNYSGQNTTSGITTTSRSTTASANAWEFPLLLKYRFGLGMVRPYVDAGFAWDTLSGLKQAVTITTAGILSSSGSSTPAELHKKGTSGFVMGAGLDVKALVIHVSPEVRYTHWGSAHFEDPLGLLRSNQNQAEFLLGITF
jgi:opacity protein-like surface antigen